MERPVGATGSSMSGVSGEPRIRAKKHRMLFVAGDGLLILIPAALYLVMLASRGTTNDRDERTSGIYINR
jgi:hypothetical protein